MREIKFRAWDAVLKLMLIQNPVLSFHLFHITPNGDVYENGKVRDLTLMQYTGLKDKNGVEIYEGDIVERCAGSGGGKNWRNKKYIYKFEVSFVNGCFRYGDSVLQFSRDEFRLEQSDIRIIGNIYENPELWKMYRILRS